MVNAATDPQVQATARVAMVTLITTAAVFAQVELSLLATSMVNATQFQETALATEILHTDSGKEVCAISANKIGGA